VLTRVTVLLATFQGRPYLDELLTSVLGQTGVDVQVVVSDDGSTDGTWELLSSYDDPRVTLLPRVTPSGSAAANFYRLLRDSATDGLVAFADQDDVWEPDKLARHVALVEAGAVGVSSNVLTLDPAGGTALLRKDFPQRAFDWVFEGPGPGCSMLLAPQLVARLREVLTDPDGLAARCDYHDWLTYAVCRASGWEWRIDAHPSLLYRQHAANVMGANMGVSAALRRLRLAREGWHRRQAADLARLGLAVGSDAGLAALLDALESRSLPRRWRLARLASQARRRPRDRAVFAALVASGLW
jgi:rhamnosyltransferase